MIVKLPHSLESYAALKKVQEIRKYVEDGVGDEKERVKKFQKGIAYHQTYDEEDSLGYENSGYENGMRNWSDGWNLLVSESSD